MLCLFAVFRGARLGIYSDRRPSSRYSTCITWLVTSNIVHGHGPSSLLYTCMHVSMLDMLSSKMSTLWKLTLTFIAIQIKWTRTSLPKLSNTSIWSLLNGRRTSCHWSGFFLILKHICYQFIPDNHFCDYLCLLHSLLHHSITVFAAFRCYLFASLCLPISKFVFIMRCIKTYDNIVEFIMLLYCGFSGRWWYLYCSISDDYYSNSWWRGTVVERRSLTGELSLSCARPAADGWPLMW